MALHLHNHMNSILPHPTASLRLMGKILSVSVSMIAMSCLQLPGYLYASQELIDVIPPQNDLTSEKKTFTQTIQATIFESVNETPCQPDFLQTAILTGDTIKQKDIVQAVTSYKNYLVASCTYELIPDNPEQTNHNRNFAVNTAMDALRNDVADHPNNIYLTYLYLNRLIETPIVDFQETGGDFSKQDQLLLNQIQENPLFNNLILDGRIEVQNQAYHIAKDMENAPFLRESIRSTNPDASDQEIEDAATQYTTAIKASAMQALIPLWQDGHEKARDYVAQHLLSPINVAVTEIQKNEEYININLKNIKSAQELINVLQKSNDNAGIERCQQTIEHLTKTNDRLRQEQTTMIEKTQEIIKRYIPFMELNRSMQSFILQHVSGRGIPANEPVWLKTKILTAVGEHYGLNLKDFLEGNQVNYEHFYDAVLLKLQEKFDPDLMTATLTWRALNANTANALPTLEGLMETYERASPYGFYETLYIAMWQPSYFHLFFNQQNVEEGTQKHKQALEDLMAHYFQNLLETDKQTKREDGRKFMSEKYTDYLKNNIKSYDALKALQQNNVNLSNLPQGQSTPERLIQTMVNGKLITMVASTNQHYPENEQAGISYSDQEYLENIDKITKLALQGAHFAQIFIREYVENALNEPAESVFSDMDLWSGLSISNRLKLSFDMLNAFHFLEKQQQISQ